MAVADKKITYTAAEVAELIRPLAQSVELLQISFRGAELKLPAQVDLDAVAALLRSVQSL